MQWCKNPLQICKGVIVMDRTVEQARTWAEFLVQNETRCPGDIEGAMRRLETRYAVSWRTFWALRYRPPSEVFASVYMRLQEAYRAECERQKRRLQHEIEITETIAGANHNSVVAAKALACESMENRQKEIA